MKPLSILPLLCLSIAATAAPTARETRKNSPPAKTVSASQDRNAQAKFKMVVQKGHGAPVTSLAFSPDGTHVLSGDSSGAVLLWTADGRLLQSTRGPERSAETILFLPDGKKYIANTLEIKTLQGDTLAKPAETADKALPSPDGESVVYIKGKQLYLQTVPYKTARRLGVFDSEINALSLSKNGRLLAAGFGSWQCTANYSPNQSKGERCDTAVRLWSLPDGKLLRTFTEHAARVDAVALSPDGKTLASGGLDTKIKFCDTATGACKTRTLHRGSVQALAWNPDGSMLASSGNEGKVLLWGPQGQYKASISFRAPGGGQFNPSAAALAWSPDGKILLAGMGDAVVKSNFNIIAFNPDGSQAGVFGSRRKSPIEAVSFDPDGEGFSIITQESERYHWTADFSVDGVFSQPELDLKKLTLSQNAMVMAGAGKETLQYFDLGGHPLNNHKFLSAKFIVNFDASITAEASKEHFLSLRRQDGTETARYNIAYDKAAFSGHVRDSNGLWKVELGFVTDMAFSPEGKEIAWLSGADNTLQTAPVQQGSAKTLVPALQLASIVVWSGDGSRLITAGGNGWQIFDRDGRQLSRKESGYIAVNAITASKDGKHFACGYANGKLEIYSMDGQLIRALPGHDAKVTTLAFSPDGRYLISGSEDATARLWNTATGESAAFISAGDGSIVFTPDGYFDASANGGDFVQMTSGTDGYAVDQFALRFNRPDLILKRLGWGSPDAIAAFHAQYLKRLRRAGMTEEQLAFDKHLPEGRIISLEKQGNTARLALEFTDSGVNLRRYNVYANGVPLFGEEGKPLRGRSARVTETVVLTPGTNRLEVSCVNEKGAESYRAVDYAQLEGAAKPALYYIGFGVSKYKDSSLDLDFAAKDAADLGALLAKATSTFCATHLKTYLDEQVTPQAIRDAKTLLKDARPEDTFILFIAGHGMHGMDKDATYYYLTHNTDRNDIAGTAADFSIVEDLLQGIAPRRKLFLMDTCESGELDPAEETAILARAEPTGLKSRGMKRADAQTAAQAAPRARPWLLARDRYIYNDLNRRSGTIVFSSSRGGELSYEDPRIGNGIFTGRIKQALSGNADRDHDGMISTDELREFVAQAVATDTKGAQHPVVDRDNIYQKFGLPPVK